MYEKSGLLSLGKASSSSTALSTFYFMCAMFLSFHVTGWKAYSFTTAAYRMLNVCTHLGACCRHKGESGRNMSAQELTRTERKTCPHHPALPGDRTQGLPDLHSDALNTELRPPLMIYECVHSTILLTGRTHDNVFTKFTLLVSLKTTKER